MPVFCAAMMNLFEGNQQILNIYSEADKPQNFFAIVCILMVILLIIMGIGTGVIGYMAFGAASKSTLLFNLPNGDPLSITAKICYVFTLMGSFVLLAQPIFYVIESANWY